MFALKIKRKNFDSGTAVSYTDLKQYILYFVSMFLTMRLNIYRGGSTVGIEINLLLDQVPANPYDIYYVIFSERKEIMEVFDSKLYINI